MNCTTGGALASHGSPSGILDVALHHALRGEIYKR